MGELLRVRGHKVRIIDPVAVLVTEGGIMESSVNIDLSRQRYQMLPKIEGAITLMAGFCGGNQKGELVLLGRNGSDYSAACLAAISNAECCEIWTDVDGVYSCDPRAVPDAVLLRRMSYKEAMELSYFGAKVLHPRTISPIARFHIPCLIKNTMNPQGEGTLIAEETDRSMPIKGISDLKNRFFGQRVGPGNERNGGHGRKIVHCSIPGSGIIGTYYPVIFRILDFFLYSYSGRDAHKTRN